MPKKKLTPSSEFIEFLNSESIATLVIKGLEFKDSGDYEKAIACFDQVLIVDPDFSEAYYHRGNALFDQRRFFEAIESYDCALAINPALGHVLQNKAISLHNMGRLQEAVDAYQQLLVLDPGNHNAQFGMGTDLESLGQLESAIRAFELVVSIDQAHIQAYLHSAECWDRLGNHQKALEAFDKAAALDSTRPEIFARRGNILQSMGRVAEAIHEYDQALSIEPQYPYLKDTRLLAKLGLSDWRNLDQEIVEFSQAIERGDPIASTFPVLVAIDSLKLQRKATSRWANSIYPENSQLGLLPKYPRHRKTKVAYFSADFRNHAVTMLTAELFETHDRNQFEIIAFAFGPPTDDSIVERLKKAFDQFIDVRELTDLQVASLARQMEIDIAVDLGGYTANCRTGIFALRAAPIQIGYLGYLGTWGTSYMDYIIADSVIIPEESRDLYSEKIIYLPAFQVNDSQRVISDRVFNRAELGLPENAIVYCCFNNTYKILPKIFASWMRILKAVDGSVLFLYASNSSVEQNLRNQAIENGIKPERLVFGGRLAGPEYLSRYRVCDLFLDTSPYNAGTTASDALWAGLPVLSYLGETFASRMAASLLKAVGLPELATTSISEYEALAIDLGTNPQKIDELKRKLAMRQSNSALFNTTIFTRNLEFAYTKVIDQWHLDLPFDHIVVKSNA
ncbi:tetratricopeptide repeat protein [Polynucleobacter paneuropaeus]|nr:tetratricopeptide repeat protein [Polynucleobacter paneuropaeus]MBT8530994.1 tetratricopeptide repeat protein [Polynucleobacter paneuropaeus]MBT8602449.1 tetratricopeptide repeat protein [Polynucleobacter paneuropaeus]MBT8624402.1 tetratricopeptide repeat protein [Polynucleobacter paneuropaeus]MBT8628713.1 tetratricopeptide repeat protein [Polynucleobacter paneuropaeus]